MIISHKHKFIFIKTKKTAGTSIETLLASICGDEDIISEISEEEERRKRFGIVSQNNLVPLKKYSFKDWARFILYKRRKKFNGHMSSVEIINYIGLKKWNEYYTFCFDRSPIEKTISMFYWKGGMEKFKSFDEFLENHKPDQISNWNFYTENNILKVDKVYKFEDLKETLVDLSHRFNVKWEYLIHEIKFKSNQRKGKCDINEKQRKKIKDIHMNEIELLKYDY